MAFFEENWQMKGSTIAERTSFIYNTEILSDVKFVVPVSTDESQRKMAVPGHKFVLAISSPVFFAMFYGQMAETTDSIELPDCDYESLLEFFRYLYSDEVRLSGRTVMQVLYLANKYMVPFLAGKCNEFLQHNLKASNVFCILPFAQKFEDKGLQDRCWEMIEKQTEEAVMSDEFVTLERSAVEAVVKKERLNVHEVELFRAIDRWASRQSEKQGLTSDGESKRRILGEEIVKAIRFPLMSQMEFGSVVMDSHLLTSDEVASMIEHFNNVSISSGPFSRAPRAFTLDVFRLQRFGTINPPDMFYWGYGTWAADCINFSVDKPILLIGVQHFGSEGGEYKALTGVKEITESSSLAKQSGSYISQKDETYGYYAFVVQFDRPVRLEENKEYELVSLINGPKSWYGTAGQTSVECEGVRFTFRTSDGSTNATSELRGQFPAFLLAY